MSQVSDAIAGRPMQTGVVWEFPAKKLVVQLDYGVVDGIGSEVAAGFGMLPRRGAEVGGLLLGRAETRSRQTAIVIEGFDPVPCTYPTGPSYHFAEADRLVLEAKLARWVAGPDKRLSVVGFYRSHTRSDFFMDEQDNELCSKYFPDPQSVFLLVRPFATRAAVAGFFFWEDGRLEREPRCQEFLFQRSELGGGRARATPAEPERPPGWTEAAPEPEPPEPLKVEAAQVSPGAPPHSALGEEPAPPFLASEPNRRSFRWVAIPAVAAALLGGAYWGWLTLRAYSPPTGQAAAPPRIGLDLAAAEAAGQIEVSWNRSAPAVLAAERAVFTISDGLVRKEMELDREQIRSMHKLLYTPVTSDVGFRLEVFSGNSAISESVRVVRGMPASQTPEVVAMPVVPAAPKSGLPAAVRREPARPTPPPVTEARPAAATKPEPPPKPAEASATPETAPVERVIPRPERRR